MNWEMPEVYAVKHADENIRALSRSGGIFTAVSDYVLDQGGVVYGSVLTKDFKAVHARAEDKETRDLMRGSKYVQSVMGNTFANVKKDLSEGKKVLFTGTSCQVAGLLGFLGGDNDNLICMDIVCHGVPSPLVWEKYLKWQEKAAKSKAVKVDFRNKKDFGWKDHVETIWFANGESTSSRIYTKLFYDHNILRPCCYECKYKTVMHPGDITIADYWGIDKAAPGFSDNKGVSLVLVNNDKAAKLFEEVKDTVVWQKTRIEDSMQTPLKAPCARPAERDVFWKDFGKRSFGFITRKYCENGIIDRTKAKLRKLKRSMVG